MKSPALFRSSLLLAGLAWTVPVLPAAQNAPTQSAARPAESNSARFTLEIHSGFIIDGGKQTDQATVGNILAYLKKKNSEFSLSLGPGVADVTVGDMILRMEQFDIGSICEAIVNSANEPLGGSFGGPVSKLVAGEQQRTVAVFNLTSYLNPDGKADSKTVEEKLTSLRQIILLTLRDANPHGSNSNDPGFQFHSGANLLVVTGNEQAIDVASKVVNALTTPTVYASQRYALAARNYAPGPDPQKTLEGSLAAMSRAQLQSMMDTLRKEQAQVQGSLPPAVRKQYQQHLDELDKLIQDIDRQMKYLGNNSPLMIPGGNAGEDSPSVP